MSYLASFAFNGGEDYVPIIDVVGSSSRFYGFVDRTSTIGISDEAKWEELHSTNAKQSFIDIAGTRSHPNGYHELRARFMDIEEKFYQIKEYRDSAYQKIIGDLSANIFDHNRNFGDTQYNNALSVRNHVSKKINDIWKTLSDLFKLIYCSTMKMDNTVTYDEGELYTTSKNYSIYKIDEPSKPESELKVSDLVNPSGATMTYGYSNSSGGYTLRSKTFNTLFTDCRNHLTKVNDSYKHLFFDFIEFTNDAIAFETNYYTPANKPPEVPIPEQIHRYFYYYTDVSGNRANIRAIHTIQPNSSEVTVCVSIWMKLKDRSATTNDTPLLKLTAVSDAGGEIGSADLVNFNYDHDYYNQNYKDYDRHFVNEINVLGNVLDNDSHPPIFNMARIQDQPTIDHEVKYNRYFFKVTITTENGQYKVTINTMFINEKEIFNDPTNNNPYNGIIDLHPENMLELRCGYYRARKEFEESVIDFMKSYDETNMGILDIQNSYYNELKFLRRYAFQTSTKDLAVSHIHGLENLSLENPDADADFIATLIDDENMVSKLATVSNTKNSNLRTITFSDVYIQKLNKAPYCISRFDGWIDTSYYITTDVKIISFSVFPLTDTTDHSFLKIGDATTVNASTLYLNTNDTGRWTHYLLYNWNTIYKNGIRIDETLLGDKPTGNLKLNCFNHAIANILISKDDKDYRLDSNDQEYARQDYILENVFNVIKKYNNPDLISLHEADQTFNDLGNVHLTTYYDKIDAIYSIYETMTFSVTNIIGDYKLNSHNTYTKNSTNYDPGYYIDYEIRNTLTTSDYDDFINRVSIDWEQIHLGIINIYDVINDLDINTHVVKFIDNHNYLLNNVHNEKSSLTDMINDQMNIKTVSGKKSNYQSMYRYVANGILNRYVDLHSLIDSSNSAYKLNVKTNVDLFLEFINFIVDDEANKNWYTWFQGNPTYNRNYLDLYNVDFITFDEFDASYNYYKNQGKNVGELFDSFGITIVDQNTNIKLDTLPSHVFYSKYYIINTLKNLEMNANSIIDKHQELIDIQNLRRKDANFSNIMSDFMSTSMYNFFSQENVALDYAVNNPVQSLSGELIHMLNSISNIQNGTNGETYVTNANWSTYFTENTMVEKYVDASYQLAKYNKEMEAYESSYRENTLDASYLNFYQEIYDNSNTLIEFLTDISDNYYLFNVTQANVNNVDEDEDWITYLQQVKSQDLNIQYIIQTIHNICTYVNNGGISAIINFRGRLTDQRNKALDEFKDHRIGQNHSERYFGFYAENYL